MAIIYENSLILLMIADPTLNAIISGFPRGGIGSKCCKLCLRIHDFHVVKFQSHQHYHNTDTLVAANERVIAYQAVRESGGFFPD